MAKSPYMSRKLLNELKKLEKESGDMMLTHNLHDIAINGKRGESLRIGPGIYRRRICVPDL